MERFEIIEEVAIKEIEFQGLCQSKTYAVFDLDQFFIYNKGCLYSLTGDQNINIDLHSNIEAEGTHFVAEFESTDDALDFFNRKWKQPII
jgi:hypothetical protein